MIKKDLAAKEAAEMKGDINLFGINHTVVKVTHRLLGGVPSTAEITNILKQKEQKETAEVQESNRVNAEAVKSVKTPGWKINGNVKTNHPSLIYSLVLPLLLLLIFL